MADEADLERMNALEVQDGRAPTTSTGPEPDELEDDDDAPWIDDDVRALMELEAKAKALAGSRTNINDDGETFIQLHLSLLEEDDSRRLLSEAEQAITDRCHQTLCTQNADR